MGAGLFIVSHLPLLQSTPAAQMSTTSCISTSFSQLFLKRGTQLVQFNFYYFRWFSDPQCSCWQPDKPLPIVRDTSRSLLLSLLSKNFPSLLLFHPVSTRAHLKATSWLMLCLSSPLVQSIPEFRFQCGVKHLIDRACENSFLHDPLNNAPLAATNTKIVWWHWNPLPLSLPLARHVARHRS